MPILSTHRICVIVIWSGLFNVEIFQMEIILMFTSRFVAYIAIQSTSLLQQLFLHTKFFALKLIHNNNFFFFCNVNKLNWMQQKKTFYFLPWNLPVTWCGNGCGIEVFLGETTGIKLFPWGRQVEYVCGTRKEKNN